MEVEKLWKGHLGGVVHSDLPHSYNALGTLMHIHPYTSHILRLEHPAG